jgi:hypothetical protein
MQAQGNRTSSGQFHRKFGLLSSPDLLLVGLCASRAFSPLLAWLKRVVLLRTHAASDSLPLPWRSRASRFCIQIPTLRPSQRRWPRPVIRIISVYFGKRLANTGTLWNDFSPSVPAADGTRLQPNSTIRICVGCSWCGAMRISPESSLVSLVRSGGRLMKLCLGPKNPNFVITFPRHMQWQRRPNQPMQPTPTEPK